MSMNMTSGYVLVPVTQFAGTSGTQTAVTTGTSGTSDSLVKFKRRSPQVLGVNIYYIWCEYYCEIIMDNLSFEWTRSPGPPVDLK